MSEGGRKKKKRKTHLLAQVGIGRHGETEAGRHWRMRLAKEGMHV